LETIDIIIVLSFVLYAITSGLRAKGQASKNLEEYFLAGRSLKGWQAGISMSATQFAADTPLNVMGIIAVSGIFALWQMWIYALAFLMMGFVLASSWRNAGVLTDAELTEIRYGKRPAAVLRGFKALYFGTLFNCIVLAWVFFAGAKIAEPFLLWHQWLSPSFFNPVVQVVEWMGVTLATVSQDDPDVWIKTASNFISIFAIIAVTTFYSATGGLRAVVRTDIAQFVIMMVGTTLFAWFVIKEVGGLPAMTQKIQAQFANGGPGGIRPNEILAFTPTQAKDVSFGLLALFALQWLIQLNADGTGYLAQRSMACRSEKDAKIAAVVFTVTQVILRSLLWLPIGLGLMLIYPPDMSMSVEQMTPLREVTFVWGMAELLPPGVKGIMLTGMLAALASTVDTHINWGSSYWTNDIYKRFVCQAWLNKKPSDRSLVWVARGSNFLIIGIALAIMTQLKSINQTWQISLLLGAGMGVVLILRWIWWRMNAWAEIAAISSSLIFAWILMVYYPDMEHAWKLLIMAIISTVAALLAIQIKGPEDKKRLQEFYKRVRPPGYWGPIARSLNINPNEGPRRLWRGVSAMFVSAFSFFCILTGLGTLLVGGPSPIWFPWVEIWIILLLILGTVLTPVWWRLGFGEK